MNYNYHQYRAGRAGNLTTTAWKLAQLFIPVLDTRYFQAVYTSARYCYSAGYLRHFVGFVLSLGDRRAVILAHFKFRPAPPAWSLLRAWSLTLWIFHFDVVKINKYTRNSLHTATTAQLQTLARAPGHTRWAANIVSSLRQYVPSWGRAGVWCLFV